MTEQERSDWIRLAEVLGYRPARSMEFIESSLTGIHMLLCGDDATGEHTRETIAMLHGLACLKVNGRCWWAAGGSVWYWDINGESGEAKSHASALLSMLTAHEEATQ